MTEIWTNVYRQTLQGNPGRILARRLISVEPDMTKSAGNYHIYWKKIDHISWKKPYWKTSFFVQIDKANVLQIADNFFSVIDRLFVTLGISGVSSL